MLQEDVATTKDRESRARWGAIGRTLDGLIGAISPNWALRRSRARAAMSIMNTYRGAEKTRLRQDWLPGSGSADADILGDLPTLRERSRDLTRNDAHASAIANTVVMNTIGSGIKPQCRLDRDALNISDDVARPYERAAERAWKKWCPQADAQNRADFYELEALIMRQILENGEVFIIPLMIKDEPWRNYRLALEVIEADRIMTPTDRTLDKNIRDGIELGARNEPVAYWVRRQHPGDLALPRAAALTNRSENFIRYPAYNKAGRKNIFHLYWVQRPGQSRGVPFFAPVLSHFKDLADYLEAELVAARVAACFAAFVEKSDAYGAAVGAATSTGTNGQRMQELEPGMIEYLNAGEKISFGDPKRPGTTFEPFVVLILRAIGASLGLPFELVMKDFSKTNYSSARAALLEARRFFRTYQQWLGSRFCQPVWEMLLEEAWLREQLPGVNLYGPERDLWLQASWIAPGWGWVDPVKEVQSSDLAIKAGLSTKADECAAQGRDWDDVAQQLKREQDRYKELGVLVETPDVPTDTSDDQPVPTQGVPAHA